MADRRYTPTSVRKLVDKFFSLQWCRDNLVVPLYEETSLPMSNSLIKIAIANYSYLGTIASPIKERLSQSGYKCEFVERSQEEIQEPEHDTRTAGKSNHTRAEKLWKYGQGNNCNQVGLEHKIYTERIWSHGR